MCLQRLRKLCSCLNTYTCILLDKCFFTWWYTMPGENKPSKLERAESDDLIMLSEP